jgi:hypothetical protein
MDALKRCDAVVAVQPFGRSASLELGWAAGAGKFTVLLLSDGEPELMVKMCNRICLGLGEVLLALQEYKRIAAAEAAGGAEELEAENARLRAELVKIYDAVGSEKVSCPRCGGKWFVPKQFWGDPRFDCPHCEAAKGDENICGFCGKPGADKMPHPIRWPGEQSAGTERVHTECEQEECKRAHAALSDAEREAFLRTV